MLIAHTTDLSESDEVAFEHALALASQSAARLASVHACTGPDDEGQFPSAERTLSRWGDARSVEQQVISHQCCDDVTDTLLDALGRLQPELVVCSTHARTGLARLFGGSVAEGLARNLPSATLVLPQDGKSFVDSKTGRLTLRRLLVAAGSESEAQHACDAAGKLLVLAGARDAEIILLHVDDGRPMPTPRLPEGTRCSPRAVRGPLDAAIVDTAQELDVDCVVMATGGHDGIGDVLWGSHTERVLHHCQRPMLWVPL